MHWTDNYKFFLFDLDGTLVDTESLHFHAYKKMCSNRGFYLKWDFKTYSQHSTCSSISIKENIYKSLPELYKNEPNWDVLYQEKKQIYLDILDNEKISLMPGVEKFLNYLAKKEIKTCVVTHSYKEQADIIKRKQPLLNTIQKWITREFYNNPKPDPECYKNALNTFGNPENGVVGFEDSERGLQALLEAKVDGILVSNFYSKDEIDEIGKNVRKKFRYASTFHNLLSPKKGLEEAL